MSKAKKRCISILLAVNKKTVNQYEPIYTKGKTRKMKILHMQQHINQKDIVLKFHTNVFIIKLQSKE